MDLLKAKVYLDKLNREYQRLGKDPENITRLDVDIVASYVRELYDAILSEVQTAPHKAEPAPVKRTAHVAPTPSPAPVPAPPPVVVAEPVPAPPPPPPPPPPVVIVEPAPAPPPPPPPPPPVVVVEPIPVPPPKPAPEPVAKAPATAVLADFDILFEEKQAKELSEKLSDMPIADLRRGIALNDRLLLTRELFAGDGQAFEQTIGMLNSFNNFSDAKQYLIEHCVVRYTWTDKKRLEAAKDFVKLVRRRYK